jgi:hypothetical protein
VLPELAKMRDELRALLEAPVLEGVEIRVAALPAELDRIAPPMRSGAFDTRARASRGGVTFADRRLVVLSLGTDAPGESPDLERSLRHQLAHLALDDAAGSGVIPAWFQEGFATHFAKQDRATRAQALELSTLTGQPPKISDLSADGADSSAYAADFVRFASDERELLPEIAQRIRDGATFEDALESAFGTAEKSIDHAWQKDMARRYAFLPVLVGTVLLWIVLGLVGVFRRRQKTAIKAAPDVRVWRLLGPRRKTRRERTARAAEQDDRVSATSRRVAGLRAGELEVPKVEHDGDWHTLH